MGFTMKRVIDILQNTESIEQVLKNSYRKVEYPFTRVKLISNLFTFS